MTGRTKGAHPEADNDNGGREPPLRMPPDGIMRMLMRGELDRHQFRAAREIQSVFERLPGNLSSGSMGSMRLEKIDGGMSNWNIWAIEAYTDRYKPWADKLNGNRPEVTDRERDMLARHDNVVMLPAPRDDLAPGYEPDRRCSPAIYRVVILGRSIGAVAKELKAAKRTVSQLLRDGLTLYAVIAGWVPASDLMEVAA